MKKNLRITVNGRTYDVVAEVLDEEIGPGRAASGNPAPAAAAAAAGVAAAPAPARVSRPGDSAVGAVCSPLAGKVVTIDAPAGTPVVAGQKVITLEAMKMFTTVAAQSAGTVLVVHVNAGEAVEEGQPLVSIG